MKPEEIVIRQNSSCSEWMDLEELVRADKILIRIGANDDTERKLVTALAASSAARKPVGASMRWAVCAAEDGSLTLMLQALPVPLTVLDKHPSLKSCNAPVMAVSSNNIWAKMFNGKEVSDPHHFCSFPPEWPITILIDLLALQIRNV